MHAPLESICFCGGEANPQRGMTENCLDGPFVFRLNENGVGPNLLVQVCTERGWREYTGDNASFKDRWNLWWKSGGFSQSYYKTLHPGQFINRIPKGNSICRKDNLVRHLKCMKKIYGSMYDFSPLGYNLPSEYTRLAADCSRCEKDDRIWICKPVGQSQGKGIFLFRKLSDLTYDSVAVVQRYIQNPLLIGGYKFDLRLYVCVPSYSPLAIYVYNEGLARFATEKFSLENLDDPLRHLTNFSLNKLGPGYSERKERVGAGCKWTFRQLRRYLAQAGYCDWLLWQQIACIISLTILSQAAGIPRSSNCFEFFGFDVLIDENLKPWLLELRQTPEVCSDNWSRHNSLLSEKTLRRGFKGTVNEESPTNSVWDNGKDWKNPSAREGGWIRVYPTTMKKSANSNVFQTSFSEIPRVIDKEIKNNVLCIQKYLKSAKNIQRQFGKQGDAVCNVMLQRALDMNGQVWLPEK
ncbi:probable tubulin polyglutamylase TTLL2 isoform X2 [Belonocnema kinseyi]|uniref:probable tubulin polyglutamylase TTLL2 isoform X2 n=1 Tax=Belonocnema kinseyi TaxID=2817044 RepID=UPI00143DFC9F|nr:probable tubulin polyglutamylase TTLL2 isoform X2 [Belonocnema kinseyi]